MSKKKRLQKLIQKPLRFHHQDIHEELDAIKQQLALQNELMVCFGLLLAQAFQVESESSEDSEAQSENACS
jgi:phosphoglycerate-specific signal transduction histidine kinase